MRKSARILPGWKGDFTYPILISKPFLEQLKWSHVCILLREFHLEVWSLNLEVWHEWSGGYDESETHSGSEICFWERKKELELERQSGMFQSQSFFFVGHEFIQMLDLLIMKRNKNFVALVEMSHSSYCTRPEFVQMSFISMKKCSWTIDGYLHCHFTSFQTRTWKGIIP